MLVYVMLALGLNIVVGYAGLLDLGYVAFYALGAYTVGWFASTASPTGRLPLRLDDAPSYIGGIHLGFWLVLPLAGLIAAFAGMIIGWPTLRLRGDYLAIVTLGFGEIIPDVFRNADALPYPAGSSASPVHRLHHGNLTNGVRGISAGPPGLRRALNDWTRRGRSGPLQRLHLKPWFFTIVILVLVTIFVN